MPVASKTIRIPVVYQTAERVVSEYTTAVSKGGCLVVTKHALQPGTRFVFDLFLSGDGEPLQLEGEVVRVRQLDTIEPSYEMAVQYVSTGVQRNRIAQLVRAIAVDDSRLLVRRHPRVPVNLLAEDDTRGVRYLIRDMSARGFRVEGRDVQRAVAVGRKIVLSVMVTSRSLPVLIHGTVVWIEHGTRVVRTRLGVSFDEASVTTIGSERGSLTPALAIEGMCNLLRPAHLGLLFVPEPSDLMRSSAIRRAVRVVEGIKTVTNVIAHAQTRHLVSKTALALGPVARKTGVSSDMFCARVQLVGDFEGELVLYAAPTLAQHIAQAYVGEPAATPAAANDALTEFAVSVAGAVCEAVDAQGIDIEVIAPLVGGHPDVSVDTAVTVEMAGPHGTLIASIIAIARPPSDWPI